MSAFSTTWIKSSPRRSSARSSNPAIKKPVPAENQFPLRESYASFVSSSGTTCQTPVLKMLAKTEILSRIFCPSTFSPSPCRTRPQFVNSPFSCRMACLRKYSLQSTSILSKKAFGKLIIPSEKQAKILYKLYEQAKSEGFAIT